MSTERHLPTPPASAAGPTGPPLERTYEISEDLIANPERGLVQYVDFTDQSDVAFVTGLGVTLANVRIRLDPFRESPIDPRFLLELEAGFDRVRRAGLKVVLRFQYNNGSGKDPNLSTVLAHIDQLAPIIERHSDVIAVLQAGFIGAWGEWHNSISGLTERDARAAILARLLAALPTSRALQVRSPSFKVEALEADDAAHLTSARVGHHNDCLLASPTDRGTYPNPVERWRSYLELDSQHVPIGGESCVLNPPLTNCARALDELRRFHWSYLNRSYHPDVIEAWETHGCMDVIAKSLGYRIALRKSRWPQTAQAGDEIEIEIEIENLGFAAPFNPRDVFVVIGTGDERREIQLAGVDPRRWTPRKLHRITARITVPADLPTGRHSLALWLPDPQPMLRPWPAYSIRLANRGTWRERVGDNLLGFIDLRRAGDQFSSAPSEIQPSSNR